MKRWLLLAFFCYTSFAQQCEVYAIRSPRSAARSRGTRNAYRGPRPAVMTRYPQVAPRVVRID